VDEPTKTGEHPATNGEVRRAFQWLTLQNLVVILALLGSVSVGGQKVLRWLVQDAVAQDGGTAALVKRIDVVEAAAAQHLLDDAQAKRQQAKDTYELRSDVKALYEAVMSGKRSERLEKPLPPLDGGR
jgi:hypothetical protein